MPSFLATTGTAEPLRVTPPEATAYHGELVSFEFKKIETSVTHALQISRFRCALLDATVREGII
jgi:hypothetical protein